MKRAKISFSDAAMMDILEQAEWYQQHSDEALARKWENAVASANFSSFDKS